MVKTKIGEKTIAINKTIGDEKWHSREYCGSFHFYFDAESTVRMRLYWYLRDRLTATNYIYVDKRVRDDFRMECSKYNSVGGLEYDYSDSTVKWALTELIDKGIMIREGKGRYCFHPCKVWVGQEEGREERIKLLHKKNMI
jgi:hypothetical protein